MKFKKIVIILIAIIILITFYFGYAIKISPPEQDLSVIDTTLKRTMHGKTFVYGRHWLNKEKPGLWFMYLEGEEFQRGYAQGMLTQELFQQQEGYFVNELNKHVPSLIKQFFLKQLVGWFNRNLDEHIPLEYQKEIYGISLFADSKFSYIASPYQRILNYHASHDIGHALQNMHLVACTGLGTWDQYAEDSSMFVGRNFDFFVGEDFARDKIVAFINPEKGHKFMTVSWAGMVGVLSGMNIQGLTVTLNADKSEIPTQSGTPVSIIAREILQYASTIDEALAIAKKRQCFVAESFLIASAKDGKIAIIEKTPTATDIYYSKDSRIIIANHFQSDSLKDTKLNIENINDSTSMYRYLRVKELMHDVPVMDEKKMAKILRDQQGLKGKALGMGNPKAINQFIAHHAVIFNPYKKLAWTSTDPYQMGEFLAVDLEKIFSNSQNHVAVVNSTQNIPADSFLNTSGYQNFLHYKNTSATIDSYLSNDKKDLVLTDKNISQFINSNKEFYNVYLLLGNYYTKKKDFENALQYYQLSLSKEMPSVVDKNNIEAKVIECKEKTKK